MNAMLLMDSLGRIVHVNSAFSSLTDFDLTTIEKQSLVVLQGPNTNEMLMRQYQIAIDTAQTFEMVIYLYKRDRTCFLNRVTMVPIRGGYMNSGTSLSFNLNRSNLIIFA